MRSVMMLDLPHDHPNYPFVAPAQALIVLSSVIIALLVLQLILKEYNYFSLRHMMSDMWKILRIVKEWVAMAKGHREDAKVTLQEVKAQVEEIKTAVADGSTSGITTKPENGKKQEGDC